MGYLSGDIAAIRDRLARKGLDGGGVVVFDGGDISGLEAIFGEQERVWLDAACGPAATVAWPQSAELVLRLATRTVLRLDVAAAVAGLAVRRFPTLAGRAEDVRRAVQEALGNAVIHGNLALDGSLRASLEGLQVFAAAMADRQSDPVLAARPLTVTAQARRAGVEISVEDKGTGFTPPPVPTEDMPTVAAGGQGLAIIARSCDKVWFSRGGRRITMLFAVGLSARPRWR